MIPIYVEGRLGRRRDSRAGEEVRGYALAIGWRPLETTDRSGFRRPDPPEVSYLVADPRRERPTWVQESMIVKHFCTFLSGVPEPRAVEEPAD